MKILFICGSFEPGCDGVGDYTRTLALELINRGMNVCVLALKDTFVTEAIELQNGNNLPVYRLPSAMSKTARLTLAKSWIDNMNPDIVSIQFVIYSFHVKGLPWGIGREMKSIIGSRVTHIMFHELWIGFTKISTVKHKIYGFLQKRIIKQLILSVAPKFISTTNGLYQLLLQQFNLKIHLLPLFSNIPEAVATPQLNKEILDRLNDKEGKEDWLFTGIFGNLYPQARLEKAIEKQYQSSKSAGQKMAFIGIGKMNSEGVNEFNRLQEVFKERVSFLHLGEQDEEVVSNFLQLLHIGFSCTPTQHIGKSGVFAAMKLHQVEVVLPTAEIIPEYQAEIEAYQKDFIKRPAFMWSVQYISEKFLDILNPILNKTTSHVRG